MSGPASGFSRRLDGALDGLLFLALAGMTGVVALNVFCRFVLGFSLSWADETAMILMVWLTFLGAAVAMRDRMHYAFDYLVRSLPPTPRRTVRRGGQLLVLALTLLLLFWSVQVVVLITDWVMPATGIRRAWVYAACPVGCVFLLYYQVRQLRSDWGRPDGETAPKEEG